MMLSKRKPLLDFIEAIRPDIFHSGGGDCYKTPSTECLPGSLILGWDRDIVLITHGVGGLAWRQRRFEIPENRHVKHGKEGIYNGISRLPRFIRIDDMETGVYGMATLDEMFLVYRMSGSILFPVREIAYGDENIILESQAPGFETTDIYQNMPFLNTCDFVILSDHTIEYTPLKDRF